jgi:hypothetical protein
MTSDDCDFVMPVITPDSSNFEVYLINMIRGHEELYKYYTPCKMPSGDDGIFVMWVDCEYFSRTPYLSLFFKTDKYPNKTVEICFKRLSQNKFNFHKVELF